MVFPSDRNLKALEERRLKRAQDQEPHMDERATEAIKKALAVIEYEIARFERYRARDDILRQSRDELKEILNTEEITTEIPAPDFQASQNSAERLLSSDAAVSGAGIKC